jgi:hypothetical protein
MKVSAKSMKTILTLLFALTVSCMAGDPRPGDYMSGSVCRDVTSALAKAKTSGKPIVLITYDPNNKEMSSPYAMGGFFKMPETKKLLADNFVQAWAPWPSKGVEQFRDLNDKTSLPVAIFIKQDGTVMARVPFQYGPADALRQVQAVVAKLGVMS